MNTLYYSIGFHCVNIILQKQHAFIKNKPTRYLKSEAENYTIEKKSVDAKAGVTQSLTSYSPSVTPSSRQTSLLKLNVSILYSRDSRFGISKFRVKRFEV